jgi:hypothetical protein
MEQDLPQTQLVVVSSSNSSSTCSLSSNSGGSGTNNSPPPAKQVQQPPPQQLLKYRIFFNNLAEGKHTPVLFRWVDPDTGQTHIGPDIVVFYDLDAAKEHLQRYYSGQQHGSCYYITTSPKPVINYWQQLGITTWQLPSSSKVAKPHNKREQQPPQLQLVSTYSHNTSSRKVAARIQPSTTSVETPAVPKKQLREAVPQVLQELEKWIFEEERGCDMFSLQSKKQKTSSPSSGSSNYLL